MEYQSGSGSVTAAELHEFTQLQRIITAHSCSLLICADTRTFRVSNQKSRQRSLYLSVLHFAFLLRLSVAVFHLDLLAALLHRLFLVFVHLTLFLFIFIVRPLSPMTCELKSRLTIFCSYLSEPAACSFEHTLTFALFAWLVAALRLRSNRLRVR